MSNGEPKEASRIKFVKSKHTLHAAVFAVLLNIKWIFCLKTLSRLNFVLLNWLHLSDSYNSPLSWSGNPTYGVSHSHSVTFWASISKAYLINHVFEPFLITGLSGVVLEDFVLP